MTDDFCTHCGDLRNKKRGVAILDSKRIGDHGLDLAIELTDYGLWLTAQIDGDVTCATPISYCPICGKRLEVEV